MKKRLTTAQLRYSSVVRIFLLLLCLSGGGSLWADEVYTVTSNGSTINTTSGATTFAAGATYQATEHVSMYVGSGWNIESGKITGSALPQNGNGNYSYNNYLLPTSGAYLILTPSQNGSITLNATKNSGGNKYMVIQTSNTAFVSDATVKSNGSSCAWKNDRNGYNTPETSSGNTDAIVATFNVTAGTPYYVLFDSFNAWSFTGFTFRKQAVDIADSDFGFIYSSKKTYKGESYEGNMFVNRHNVSVSYSSSDENVATVNASTGDVTLVGAGTATITASFEGNSDYNSKNASYTLNVGSELVPTDIPIAYLRYQPGEHGINATQMARTVGGIDLSFSGGDGIKCNNTNNFYFRTNSSGQKGEMTIAMDESNSSTHIKKIVFTAYSAATMTLPIGSVTKNSGTLTKTGPTEWTWTNFTSDVSSVTFTSQGENDESILISGIKVYTDATPTFTKFTPIPAFNRNSDNYSVGASVAISDLAINTTPGSFFFDYTFDAGTTTLTHDLITTNATWPGTITGTAAEGTATISASFDGSSNPFFNTVASTNVYTLTVSSAAKNTFVWDFTTLSSVDTKLLNVATKDTWVLSGGNWQPTGGATIAGPISQNSKELEYVYGLELYNGSTNDTNTLIYGNGNGGGFRLNSGSGRYLRIPNLKAGDKVTVLCNNFNADRGITIPANIKNDANATGWGAYGSKGEYTCVGYVKEDGNVDLASTSAMDVRRITVESANKAWPTLSFANGSTVNVEIPYNGDPLTYTNALSSVPAGATATYSILLDENTGDDAATIDSSTGALTIKKTGEIIVRATVTDGTYNSAYYCDYILNATQASEFASWEYSADSKEIDGEDRPYQGTVTFTSSGKIDDTNRVITDVPGITLTVGASGEDWTVTQGTFTKGGSTWNAGLVAHNTTASNRPTCTTGCYFDFVPTVNGELTVNYYTEERVFLYKNNLNTAGNYEQWDDTRIQTKSKMLIAGNKYTLASTSTNLYLHSFTFRPAFLTPDKTAEQTATFVANSSTTAFPKLVQSADAGVRFSGNRSVVNLSNDGGVTLVGGGTAVVRGKVIAGENELTASYTLEANVLSVSGMTPANGSTITTLDNSSVYIQFSDNIDDSTVDATKVVVLKDAQQLTGINVAKAGSSVSLHEKTLVLSGFTSMEAGSTYTIRLMSGCVSKDGDATVKNPEFIGTFTVESSEPPLNWVYPSTTSAVRIGTSIVLQTNNNIDENYPNGGVIGTLTYEDDADDSDYPMSLVAIKDGKNLVFKPTKPMVPNKLYTLTIGANQVKLKDATSMITKDKVFMFTTGTATGSAPVLESSTPADGDVIDLPSNTTKIDLYFDQNLELEPYSTVSIIPVNGSESLSRGNSEKLDNNGVLVAQNMTIDSNNPKHLSFEVGSDLKYDLYYEMVIPANIVTAPGGMPNSAYTVKFKVNRNPNSTEVTPATFYPHTWDFNKLGDSSTDGKTAYELIEHANKYGTYGNVKNCIMVSTSSDNYTTYTNRGSDNNRPFDQGADVYIATGSSSNYKLPEFEGIRISLVKPTQNRFELRNVTSKETANKNLDGTDKWQFRMIGNTHYMTLSNVPEGKLYMVINTKYIGINSPNATFEEVEGATISNEGTLMNTNGYTKKVVINVTEAGDVSFCVKDFTCEKIAVAADTKTFKKNYVKDGNTYATDRLSYNVRYDLLNAFTSHNVKAYYVSAITDNAGVNAADITGTQVDPKNAVKADQGILAVYQGAVSADTEVPIFKADVNTVALEVDGSTLKNMLKVIGNDETTFPASEEGFYNYVLSPKGTKTTGVGFYRYTGSGFSPRAAYLPMPIAYVNTGSGSSSTPSKGTRLLLLDADEQVATAILEVKGDGIATRNNDGYYYNLNGMRVDQPKAGIYIRNGKKVVMK